jgi:PIF1-like helicase
MQNYHETFYRINPEAVDDQFNSVSDEENVYEQIEENDVSPFDYLDEQLIDYNSYIVDQNASTAMEATLFFQPFTDEFVASLQNSPSTPIRLSTQSNDVNIPYVDAIAAGNQLSSNKQKEAFQLPGRKRADLLDLPPCPADPATANRERCHALTTRVDLLEKIDVALSSPTTTSIAHPAITNTGFPSIPRVCAEWNLNEKQSIAFAVCAAALLQKIYVNTNPTQVNDFTTTARIHQKLNDFLPPSKQLILHLGGSGGTGKSRVIQAIANFADRWSSMANLLVCATSGIAAIVIGGCTVHKALGIQISNKPPPPKPNMVAAWSEIGLVIVDECSLLQPSFLLLLDKRLWLLKDNPDAVFGGVHIVFSGDFFQLPPIGHPLFTNATVHKSRQFIDKETMWGQELWAKCLTDAILLTTIVRQNNPIWTAALERFRINCPTLQDIQLVNTRSVGSSSYAEMPPPGTITAVSSNKTRSEAIRYAEQTFFQSLAPIVATDEHNWKSRGVLLIKANVDPQKKKQQLPEAHADYVRKLPEKLLQTVGNLICIIGTQYMVTSNLDVANGIANGTVASVRDIVLKKGTTPSVTDVGNGFSVHSVFASDIFCVILEHQFDAWSTKVCYSPLPAGYFPIKAEQFNKTIKFNDHGAGIKVRLTQFPLTNAIVLTGHKTQGLTLDHLILGHMNGKNKYGNNGWLYVILSRVRDINGLHLLTPLSTDLSKYKKRNDVTDELQRLQAFEVTTVQRVKPLIKQTEH